MRFGKYRLIAELGHGGMADVLLAATDSSDFLKLIVIKRLRDFLADDPEFVQMFLDEARVAARLNHPNVVQTLEIGKADGAYYLTMEYLDGQPLHRIVTRSERKFPLAMQLTILTDVLSGLDHAHELRDFDGASLGIVHRDVSPQNVFVTYHGQVKLVDFGIAKARGKIHQTKQGIVKGKLAYMSPEQALGSPVDRRADIFSVGVMLYEAITRRRFWQGVSEAEIMRLLAHGSLPPVPSVQGLPDSLREICARAIHRDVDQRYATAAEMQLDLEQVMEEHFPYPSARRIGRELDSLFKEHRQTTRGVIEDHLAVLVRKPSSGLVVLPTGHATLSISDDVKAKLEVADKNRASRARPTGHAPKENAPPKRSRRAAGRSRSKSRSTYKPVVLATIALLAIAALAVSASRMLTPHATVEPTASGDESRVTLTLRATPLETKFRVDDGMLLDNPFIGTFPRDGREHRISASAKGYMPAEQVVRLNDHVSVRFALTTAP